MRGSEPPGWGCDPSAHMRTGCDYKESHDSDRTTRGSVTMSTKYDGVSEIHFFDPADS